MTALETAIAELRRISPDHLNWRYASVILNAAASGDLITREASDARAGALLREAANACNGEYLECPNPENDGDIAYDRAVSDCIKAILALSPDATAALDRAVKAAREDALKDAERAAWLALKHSSSITSDLATSAIRALAQEVGQ